jgi:hypothetical protein
MFYVKFKNNINQSKNLKINSDCIYNNSFFNDALQLFVITF